MAEGDLRTFRCTGHVGVILDWFDQHLSLYDDVTGHLAAMIWRTTWRSDVPSMTLQGDSELFGQCVFECWTAGPEPDSACLNEAPQREIPDPMVAPIPDWMVVRN